jgi:hypothetical protein
MAVTVEKYPDEAIMLICMINPFEFQTELPQMIDDMARVFEASSERLYTIIDATDLELGFSEMVMGLAELAKDQNAVMRHPKALGYVIIANNDTLRLAGQALTQKQYGSLAVTVVNDGNEAFALARQEIAAEQVKE